MGNIKTKDDGRNKEYVSIKFGSIIVDFDRNKKLIEQFGDFEKAIDLEIGNINDYLKKEEIEEEKKSEAENNKENEEDKNEINEEEEYEVENEEENKEESEEIEENQLQNLEFKSDNFNKQFKKRIDSIKNIKRDILKSLFDKRKKNQKK